jgi:hypothetical protein
VDAKEVASLVKNWGFEVSGSSGSSLGALWELVAVAHMYQAAAAAMLVLIRPLLVVAGVC